MASGTTLANLLTMLKAELGQSTTVGTGTDTELKLLLSNKQKFLAANRDWPELRLEATVDISAGSRTGAKPSINFNRPYKVEVKHNDWWSDVAFGISSAEFNIFDSDNEETSDPIQRWAHYTTSTFEVWPIPATGQTVKFTGQRTLPALSATSDTCALDDLLIVLATAADLKTAAGKPDAQRAAILAANHYNSLVGASSRQQVFSLLPEEDRSPRRLVPISLASSSLRTHAGSSSIDNGVASGSVVYSVSFTPLAAVLTVRQPAGGLVLVATLVSGTLSKTGFDFVLSGTTDMEGYYLEYEVSA